MGTKKILVPFKGLNEGEHDFEFQVDDVFFGQYENSEIRMGQVAVFVDLTKRSTVLELDIGISGEVKVECDRCLELFNLPISYNGKLYVKFADETSEDDNLIVLHHNDYEVDLSQYVYEYIHLSLPVKRIHPDNENEEPGCNEEMMAKLNAHLVEEKEIEEKTDPRWDKLKEIINKN